MIVRLNERNPDSRRTLNNRYVVSDRHVERFILNSYRWLGSSAVSFKITDKPNHIKIQISITVNTNELKYIL